MRELNPQCICPNCSFKWTSAYLSSMRIEQQEQQALRNQQECAILLQKDCVRKNISDLGNLLIILEKL